MAQRTAGMKRVIVILLMIFGLIFVPVVNAASSYVLPYPSNMPGSLLYKPHLLWESILRYWYFGNFGQFKYNLMESDRYLVESKTLFEYNQFLNASISLKKSDEFFLNTLPFLLKAKKDGKDVVQNRDLLKSAAMKHMEVLDKLLNDVPKEFEWKPEKGNPTTIYIEKQIKKSIAIREKYL